MKYANHIGYTDVTPYEIVRRVSDKTLEVREMTAERDRTIKLEWAAGGFAGHCINQDDQEWTITPNPNSLIIRIRLGKRGWRDKFGGRFNLAEKPVKFYDYNF